MKIGIDVMGGDHAPVETVKGIVSYLENSREEISLVLFGDEVIIRSELEKYNINERIEIVHCSQIIEMDEHPVKATARKTDSSIVKGLAYLKDKKLDGFTSAGNTGAVYVASLYSVRNIPQISRPALFSTMPKFGEGHSVFLDCGANADCKPENLYEFGILGSIYAKHMLGVDNPKVGLLNIGEEEGKGNLIAQSAYQLMKDTEMFNFIGNVEGGDIFSEKADVIVCDGFTGNVVLKLCETVFKSAGFSEEISDKYDYENYGGSSILGLNQPVVIGHGKSKEKAIKNMILLTQNIIDSKVIDGIKNAFN